MNTAIALWLQEWQGSSASFISECGDYKEYRLCSISKSGLPSQFFPFYVDKRKGRTQGAIFIYNAPGTPTTRLANGAMAEFLEKIITS